MNTKKIIVSIFVIFIITLPFANAKNYSKSMAEAKISELEKVVLFWKGKEPKITKEIKFYTYDDRNPSYTEYKVWCKDDQDCWYIIVNEDNTDVKTPMVSFAGKTLSEQMWNKSTDKNYFFDVFNQYSISNTWEIKTTSPENKALDNGENIYSRWDDINPLYKKFLKDKKDISSKKEENKLRQSRIWKDKDYWNVWGYYTWFISDKVIDEKKCKSMVPCYHQAEVSYPPKRVSEEKKWATR